MANRSAAITDAFVVARESQTTSLVAMATKIFNGVGATVASKAFMEYLESQHVYSLQDLAMASKQKIKEIVDHVNRRIAASESPLDLEVMQRFHQEERRLAGVQEVHEMLSSAAAASAAKKKAKRRKVHLSFDEAVDRARRIVMGFQSEACPRVGNEQFIEAIESPRSIKYRCHCCSYRIHLIGEKMKESNYETVAVQTICMDHFNACRAHQQCHGDSDAALRNAFSKKFIISADLKTAKCNACSIHVKPCLEEKVTFHELERHVASAAHKNAAAAKSNMKISFPKLPKDISATSNNGVDSTTGKKSSILPQEESNSSKTAVVPLIRVPHESGGHADDDNDGEDDE
jgi:hypothetical protein